jgi:hypothetical protein
MALFLMLTRIPSPLPSPLPRTLISSPTHLNSMNFSEGGLGSSLRAVFFSVHFKADFSDQRVGREFARRFAFCGARQAV